MFDYGRKTYEEDVMEDSFLDIPNATKLTPEDWRELLCDVADVYDSAWDSTTKTGNDVRALASAIGTGLLNERGD